VNVIERQEDGPGTARPNAGASIPICPGTSTQGAVVVCEGHLLDETASPAGAPPHLTDGFVLYPVTMPHTAKVGSSLVF
jgi:hypothetical protein